MRQMNQFSEEEISVARLFYADLLKPQANFFLSLMVNNKLSQSSELILPDKMASGFMCLLGGTLLCVLPFGITQALGTGFIVAGTTMIIDGAYAGEKPYHVDTETGHVTPIDFSQQNPSIGVGTQF